MIRKFVPLVLALALSGSVALAAESRSATIDLRKVFDNYWKTKEADAALKDAAADLDKQNKSLMDDYKKATEEYQKLAASAGDQAVSAEERGKRKKSADAKMLEIKATEQTIESFRRQAGATLQEKNRRMRDKILTEIRTAIDARAKAAGYSMVLDSAGESANATPILIYNSGENDITDAILSQLNTTAPVPAAKSAADNPVADKPADKK